MYNEPDCGFKTFFGFGLVTFFLYPCERTQLMTFFLSEEIRQLLLANDLDWKKPLSTCLFFNRENIYVRRKCQVYLCVLHKTSPLNWAYLIVCSTEMSISFFEWACQQMLSLSRFQSNSCRQRRRVEKKRNKKGRSSREKEISWKRIFGMVPPWSFFCCCCYCSRCAFTSCVSSKLLGKFYFLRKLKWK